MNIKHRFIKNTFFPSTIIKWNKLDPAIWNSTSFNSFKVSILTFIRRAPKGIFQCRNSKRITYFRRLRLYFSYLHDHKFKLSFPDNINSLCTSSLEVETSNDFILYCPYYKTNPSFLFPVFAVSKVVFWIKMIMTKLKHFFIDSIALVKHRTHGMEFLKSDSHV